MTRPTGNARNTQQPAQTIPPTRSTLPHNHNKPGAFPEHAPGTPHKGVTITKLDPQTKANILADILTRNHSRNEIARRHHVAASTVTAIAKASGNPNAFDRSATKNATDAARADAKSERAELSRLLLRRAREALEAMDEPFIVARIGGKDNVYTEQLVDGPPTGDQRNLMIIAATALDKHLIIERHDTDDQNLAGVDAWLRAMMYGEVPTDPTTGDGIG